jgi:endo-1,4-beta-xylanase
MDRLRNEQCAPTTPDTLRAAAQEHDLLVGAAVALHYLRDDPEYAAVAKREFNVIVAENEFKWESFRPDVSSFEFSKLDAMVEFAESNCMKLRGHTLVWHRQNPAWLTSSTWTRARAIEIMRDHISTVVGRYKGRVFSWDVVNEAIDETGRLRPTLWLDAIGPDYIKLAFYYAHRADPDARLYLNDYGIEGLNIKSNGAYEVFRDLLAKNVPIHGVGWQSHVSNGFRITKDHQINARRLAALGLEISVTELDVRIRLPSTPEELAQQALAYGDMVRFCLAEKNCKALLTWGITDKHSWIPDWFPGEGDALPFDRNFQPKPAYTAMMRALRGAGQIRSHARQAQPEGGASALFVPDDAASNLLDRLVR